jgi:tripartite-type tricarboxylate transporter receptor subunit TctC
MPTTLALSRRLLLAAAGTLASPGLVRAQAFPSRPLRIVVPFAPGGPADTMARLGARVLEPRLGQSVVVENRAGAGGNIAAEHVARSAPDGYTLLLAGQGILAINHVLSPRLTYDPVRDFAFLGMVGVTANVILAHPQAARATSIAELIAAARANPGQITYGSFGVGSLSHLSAEVLAAAAGVQFLHVPYQGAAPMMTDLTAGRVGFGFPGAPLAVPAARAGTLRALAVTTPRRIAPLPDVPTMVELGFPQLDAPSWFALVAPSGTPAPVLARLRAEMDALNRDPGYRQALEAQTAETMPLTLEQAEALLARERQVWGEAVRRSGATAG